MPSIRFLLVALLTHQSFDMSKKDDATETDINSSVCVLNFHSTFSFGRMTQWPASRQESNANTHKCHFSLKLLHKEVDN